MLTPPKSVSAFKPEKCPDWHGSPEDKFWSLVDDLKAAGFPVGKLIKIGNLHDGDFEDLIGIVERAKAARNTNAYLSSILTGLQKENAPPPPPDPNIPAWIIGARAEGYPVEKEGKYWRFAGGLFDDDKQQVGN